MEHLVVPAGRLPTFIVLGISGVRLARDAGAGSAMASSLETACLPRVELTSLLEGLRVHLADSGVLVYVLRLRAWVVRLAVRGSAAPGRRDR
jgi:hypothetical protein